ncbi:MAG: 30S ribosomal protein S16 [Bacteroidota bacterium]
MSVKIRLQRHGSKKRPFYFIVVANTAAPRDGKFIEKLGTYNPLTIPATIRISRERALHWLDKGAQPTNTCRRILSFKGVLFLKHLMRGVSLGLFDETTAMEKFEKWNGEHEELVAKREETHRKHKAEKRSETMRDSVRKVEEKNMARAAAAETAEAENESAEGGAEAEAETTQEG